MQLIYFKQASSWSIWTSSQNFARILRIPNEDKNKQVVARSFYSTFTHSTHESLAPN